MRKQIWHEDDALEFHFGHRWQIKTVGGVPTIPCATGGTIRHVRSETLEYSGPSGDSIARAVAKLACVSVERNDNRGLIVRFAYHRIHDIARLVEPLPKHRTGSLTT